MTSFKVIYDRFESQSQNFRTLPLATPFKRTVLNEWLEYSIGNFIGVCLKELSNRTSFLRNDEVFEGDGIQTEFFLTNTPITDGEYYVALDGIEVDTDDYSYDSGDNKIVFVTAPALDVQIAVINYNMGSFSDDLDQDEINILAEFMKTPLSSFDLNNSNLLMLRVNNGDSFSHSAGAHIKAVQNVTDFNYFSMADTMMNIYSYRHKTQ